MISSLQDWGLGRRVGERDNRGTNVEARLNTKEKEGVAMSPAASVKAKRLSVLSMSRAAYPHPPYRKSPDVCIDSMFRFFALRHNSVSIGYKRLVPRLKESYFQY
jgi:hypothetical protein